MVSALQRLDRHADALQVLDQTLGLPEEPDQQIRWLEVRLNSLIHLGQWEAIDAALEQRADLEQTGEPPVVQALLRDPALREELATILWRGTARNRRSLVGYQLRQLADDHPEHSDALHRLVLTHGFELPEWRYYKGISEIELRNVLEAMDFIEQAPPACDELAERLHATTLRLLDAGKCDLAERVIATISASCEEPLHIARAEMLSARMHWEHEVHGELDGACVKREDPGAPPSVPVPGSG